MEANFTDGQIEASYNRGNGAIHRDIPVHPIVEEVVEVVQVILHERLKQRTVDRMAHAPVPQVDVTSERARKRTGAHTNSFDAKGNGAK